MNMEKEEKFRLSKIKDCTECDELREYDDTGTLYCASICKPFELDCNELDCNDCKFNGKYTGIWCFDKVGKCLNFDKFKPLKKPYAQKRKLNSIIKDQINEAFSNMILDSPLSNQIKEQLKKQNNDCIEFNRDIKKKPNKVLIGVGSINNINRDEIECLNSYDDIDDLLFTHKCKCSKCRASLPCEEYAKITDEEIEIISTVYTDGEFVELLDSVILDVKNETLIVKLNMESGTYHVIKSPKIEKHGLASLCYLGQADIDREGEHKCYVLPEQYLHD